MDKITESLCPKLLFVHYIPCETEDYLAQYIEETNGLKLSIFEIQFLRKRKNLPLAMDAAGKIKRIT